MARGCGKVWSVSRVPLGVFSFVVETRAETRAETEKHVTRRECNT